MADPVEDHLGDRSLTVRVLIAGFIINRACEAIESLGSRGVGAREGERDGGWIRACCNRDFSIDRKRLLGRDLLQDQRWRGWGRSIQGRSSGRLSNSHAADRYRGDETQKAKADRSARMGAHERAHALPPKLKGLTKVVERPEGC